MRFPYERYYVRSSKQQRFEIYRPVIYARIHAPDRVVDLRCLVDTGADFTLFPRSIADKFVIPVDDSASQPIFGIGGTPLRAAPADTELELTDGVESYRWNTSALFVSFPRPADQQTIFGHKGFLEYFTASFDGERRELELIPNNTLPADRGH